MAKWQITNATKTATMSDLSGRGGNIDIKRLGLSAAEASTLSSSSTSVELIHTTDTFGVTNVDGQKLVFVINNKGVQSETTVKTLALYADAGQGEFLYAYYDATSLNLTLKAESTGVTSTSISVPITFDTADIVVGVDIAASKISTLIDDKLSSVGYIETTNLGAEIEKLNKYALKTELEGVVRHSEIDSKLDSKESTAEVDRKLGEAKTALKQEITELDNKFVKTADLDTKMGNKVDTKIAALELDTTYAKKSEISNFISSSDVDSKLEPYAKTEALANYVPTSKLAELATKEELTNHHDDTKLNVADLDSKLNEHHDDTKLNVSDLDSKLEAKNYSVKTETVSKVELDNGTNELKITKGEEVTKISLAKYFNTLEIPHELFKNAEVSGNKLRFTKEDGSTLDIDLEGFRSKDATDSDKGVVTLSQIKDLAQEKVDALNITNYATKDSVTEVDNKITKENLASVLGDSYVKIGDLAPYAKTTALSNLVDNDTLTTKLGDYVKTTDETLAKKSEITDFITTSGVNTLLNDYATKSSLSAYVRKEDEKHLMKARLTDTKLQLSLDDDFTSPVEVELGSLKTSMPDISGKLDTTEFTKENIMGKLGDSYLAKDFTYSKGDIDSKLAEKLNVTGLSLESSSKKLKITLSDESVVEMDATDIINVPAAAPDWATEEDIASYVDMD